MSDPAKGLVRVRNDDELVWPWVVEVLVGGAWVNIDDYTTQDKAESEAAAIRRRIRAAARKGAK